MIFAQQLGFRSSWHGTRLAPGSIRLKQLLPGAECGFKNGQSFALLRTACLPFLTPQSAIRIHENPHHKLMMTRP
jgi:hypothetical protein